MMHNDVILQIRRIFLLTLIFQKLLIKTCASLAVVLVWQMVGNNHPTLVQESH